MGGAGPGKAAAAGRGPVPCPCLAVPSGIHLRTMAAPRTPPPCAAIQPGPPAPTTLLCAHPTGDPAWPSPRQWVSRALSYFSSLNSKYVRTCKRPFPSTVAASETLRPGSSSASWPRGLTEAPHGCGGLFRRGEGRGFPQRSGGAHSARSDSARGQREGPRASRLAPDLAPDVRSGCHSSPSPSGAEPPSARRVATEGKGPGRHHQSLLDFASAK